MRLTLRTLLAYLDDILEPADSQQLGEKIQESDYATGLVHRIRASMGRLRLSSPKLLGKGLGADANTVAEYLDNTLAVERVPEFEKVCLESDMNLAEVASCHQILTLVLGEPAEFDEALRQRAYAIAKPAKGRSDMASTGSKDIPSEDGFVRRIDQAVGQRALATADVRPEHERQEEIDEYFDRKKPRFLPIVLVALLGFIATSVLLLLMSGWNDSEQIVDNPEEAGQQAAPAPNWPADAVATTTEPKQFDRSTPSTQSGSDPPEVEPPPAMAPHEVSEDLATIDESSDVIPGHESLLDEAAFAPSPPAEDETFASDQVDAAPVTQRLIVDNAEPRGPAGSPGSVVGSDAMPAPTAVAATDSITKAPGITGEDPGVGAAGGKSGTKSPLEPVDVTTRRVRDVGRNIIEDQVLAVWNPVEQAWMRMAARSPVEVGLRLRGLPAFRPQLMLSNGLQVTLDEGIDLGVIEPAEDGTPRFDVANGRVIFTGVGQEIAQVGIRFGNREIAIRQGDSNSQFAVSIQQFMSPGNDPATASRHFVADVWAVSGSCAVAETGEPVRAVQAGERWTTIDARAARIAAAGDLPEWATKPRLREIDRSAVGELQPKLTTDRSLTLSLLEANQSRRTDLKSLAARCLAALDRFDPVVEAIGDRRQYPHWSRHYEQLMHAVARDPRVSERVYETLQRTRGPDADRLYRMLWGFSPLQLEQGAAEQLVADLADESLEIRVLAVESLKRITGMHLYYRPEQPLARRQVAVKNWQLRLESGDIGYAEPPLLFEDGS